MADPNAATATNAAARPGPRGPRPRAPGSMFFSPQDLSELLYAFGDPSPPPLPTTLSTLDSILVDFIVETCHAAALSASYSRRQKIKVDDFKWVLRGDGVMLGRVLENLWKKNQMAEERRAVDFEKVGNEGLEGLGAIAQAGGMGKVGKGPGPGRGRRGRKRRAEGEAGEEAGGKKRRKEE